MFDFHEKRKIKGWLFSSPVILLLLAVSVFLSTSVYERYQKERETAAKYNERAAERAQLKAHAAALAAQVAYLESARGIEEEIRDRFDATKPGERTVIVMDEIQSTTAHTATDIPNTKKEDAENHFFPWLFFWR